MKVICIDDSIYPNSFTYNWILKAGEIYTVINIEQGIDKAGIIEDNLYCLKEDPEYVYSPKRFIPLSEIDESELAEQRKELIEI